MSTERFRRAMAIGKARAQTAAKYVHVAGGLGFSLCFGTVGGVPPAEVIKATCPICIRVVTRMNGAKA